MSLNRIPTDVCIHWIDILQKNYNHPSAGKNKNLLLEILKARKLQWMTHNLTIEATKNSLKNDSNKLRQAGLHRLANIAYSESSVQNDCLYKHLPTSNNYEHTKSLLADNMYGAAFESFWVDSLVERRNSQSLFRTMEKIGWGLSTFINKLDNSLKNLFLDRLTEELKLEANSRFWHHKTSSLQQVIYGPNYDHKSKALDSILKQQIKNGFDVIIIPYLTIVIYLAYGRTLNDGKKSIPEWLKTNQFNYFRILTPYRGKNGRAYPTTAGNGKHATTSGITKLHHPPTNPMKGNPLNHRWSLMREPELLGGLTKMQLEHGIPFAGGISGTINGIAGMVTYLIKDLKLQINTQEAILGIIMFLVYDGGHSIHEALWTLYERELQNKDYLSLGLQLVPPGEKPLRGLFISNYEHFIKTYQGTETGLVLSNARNDAWQKTLLYFNTYDPHKNLFVPIAQTPAAPAIATKGSAKPAPHPGKPAVTKQPIQLENKIPEKHSLLRPLAKFLDKKLGFKF